MGCSASRAVDFIAQQENPTSNSFSLHSDSQLQSPHHTFSNASSTPASRTLSLPTPLIHHPPMRKGDSDHFVSLTSTTYGSLLLVYPQNRSFNSQDFANPSAQMRKVQDFGSSGDSLLPESVINTWELMEGLEEEEDFHYYLVEPPKKTCEIEIEHSVPPKPLWEHLSEESLLSKMDINVVSSYRGETAIPQKIKSLVADDHGDESCDLPGAENKIVLYYTSLRGIRKTYEDCCAVRVILWCFGVLVDERDISMDRSYRTELQDALKGKTLSLPQVFIKGMHIGGAEEIKQLHEAGELAKLLESFPTTDKGSVCESCGDARFVPCPNCNGSRKVYEEEDVKLRRCPDCNENGLVRCSGFCP